MTKLTDEIKNGYTFKSDRIFVYVEVRNKKYEVLLAKYIDGEWVRRDDESTNPVFGSMREDLADDPTLHQEALMKFAEVAYTARQVSKSVTPNL